MVGSHLHLTGGHGFVQPIVGSGLAAKFMPFVPVPFLSPFMGPIDRIPTCVRSFGSVYPAFGYVTDDDGGTMFAIRTACAAMGITLLLLSGCRNDAAKSYDLKVKHEEKWDMPPDAPQYNNPPESDYKKPPPKEFYKPGPGAGGMDPGGMGSAAQNSTQRR